MTRKTTGYQPEPGPTPRPPSGGSSVRPPSMGSGRANYRLRVIAPLLIPATTYLVRTAGRITYINGSEKAMELHILAGDAAAELRFVLEDAEDAQAAAKAVHECLALKLKSYAHARFNVDVLS